MPDDAHLRIGVGFYWSSFFWLSNRRGTQPMPRPGRDGGVIYVPMPEPISFEAIDRFAARHALVGGEFDRFLYIIDRMDAVFREVTMAG